MACEIDPPGCVEADSLPLEQAALQDLDAAVTRARTDPTLGVHNAVPRHTAAGRKRREHIADPPRLAAEVREPRNLAVRRDPSARDRAHGLKNCVFHSGVRS